MFRRFWMSRRCCPSWSNRCSQTLRCSSIQPIAESSCAASNRHGRNWASRPRLIKPARSSTLRCLETACSVISNGSASSFTVASPVANRARIARRVGGRAGGGGSGGWGGGGGLRWVWVGGVFLFVGGFFLIFSFFYFFFCLGPQPPFL